MKNDRMIQICIQLSTKLNLNNVVSKLNYIFQVYFLS